MSLSPRCAAAHGLRPHVAERPPERGEQHREPDQLERHVDVAPAPERREAVHAVLITPFSLRVGCLQPPPISTNRQSAFASRICGIERQLTSSSRGLATR